MNIKRTQFRKSTEKLLTTEKGRYNAGSSFHVHARVSSDLKRSVRFHESRFNSFAFDDSAV